MAEKEIMLGVPEGSHDDIELTEHRAMIYLPENAVEVEIRATVFHDSELVNVSRKMQLEDLRTAFRKADDGYIDDDDRFVLTEKGIEWLEEHGR